MNDGAGNPPGRGGGALPIAPLANDANKPPSNPVIPLHIIDAPTQRFYAVAIYFALLAWKIYDWAQLVEDNAESFWLFLKWLAIDFVFLFGLPELRIPWLEWAQPFVAALFFFHVAFDWMLMFNVGFPWQSWLLAVVKLFYDRELAISEHNVKLSNIIHNNSLIMGRQIINILPEGTAIMNPDATPFCLGADSKVVHIPIFFNSTLPVSVDVIRMDLETNAEETLKFTRAQLAEVRKQVKRPGSPNSAVGRLDFPVKKPGAYRLGPVLDNYKLEIQRKSPYTFVVPCPSARMPRPPPVRCLGDLSDMSWQVEGTPPLKISYKRSINGKDVSLHFQSLQPDGFASPLSASLQATTLVSDHDVTWARPLQIQVPMNESMTTAGDWQYWVDEVTDGFGNVVKYSPDEDDHDPKPNLMVQTFLVKERPRLHLEGCDLRNPLKVATGGQKELPAVFSVPGKIPDDTSHVFTWQFSPIDTLTENGDHGDVVSLGTFKAKNARDRPKISAPGLYTLTSVSSGSCEGEIQEPSSCLLLNPIEPELKIRSEEIPDLCAGNSVGLRVDLDLVGTPPFRVRYTVDTNGQVSHKKVEVNGMRSQLELSPPVAGHHKYKFTHIEDAVYQTPRELVGPEFELEQDVKPAANAIIMGMYEKKSACLEEDVEVSVRLQGEPPYTLEWELVHEGKGRIAHKKETGIEIPDFTIQTGPLTRGGEYRLALTKVMDKRGCSIALQQEKKIMVRRQRPRAAFGYLENKRKTTVVESARVNLPLRLAGEGPWTVSYKKVGEDKTHTSQIINENGQLAVTSRGVYQILDVRDSQCAGTVDPSASTFEVDWIPRPELSIVPIDTISHQDGKYIKNDVCQGDLDGFDISLKGTPPYLVDYVVMHKPVQGAASKRQGKIDTMSSKAGVAMDTSKAGTYVYTFSSVGDQYYDNDIKTHPLILEQKVNAKPTASFVKPGQTFKSCKSDNGSAEPIPITLTGVAPFAVEVEIKHHSGALAEVYRVSGIETPSFGLQIPMHRLKLGTQHVRIREVRDAKGCVTHNAGDGPTVQVQMYDAPAIYPLETRDDYCVGERLSFALSGTPPFEVYYTFEGVERRAKAATTSFRRIAESPGEFRITAVSDRASECRASVDLTKRIHPMPAVKISQGKNVRVDIHEGGEVDILFEFWGTPPFEFTYTRSTNERKGERSRVLETRHDVSEEHSKVVRASQEGTYEVVAIKDRYCAFSTQRTEGRKDAAQKLLT